MKNDEYYSKMKGINQQKIRRRKQVTTHYSSINQEDIQRDLIRGKKYSLEESSSSLVSS